MTQTVTIGSGMMMMGSISVRIALQAIMVIIFMEAVIFAIKAPYMLVLPTKAIKVAQAFRAEKGLAREALLVAVRKG
jgi:hypothetical protein